MGRFTTNITSQQKKSHNNIADTTVAILSAGIGPRIKSYEPRSLIKIGNKTAPPGSIKMAREGMLLKISMS